MNRSVLDLFKLADEETQAPSSRKKVEISEFPHCTRLRRELTDKVSLVLKTYDTEMCLAVKTAENSPYAAAFTNSEKRLATRGETEDRWIIEM